MNSSYWKSRVCGLLVLAIASVTACTAPSGGGASAGNQPADNGNSATPRPTQNSNSPANNPNGNSTGPAPNVCDNPGVICTFAGTGMSAFDGDGRAPERTSLYFPEGITFDMSDRPIILDWNNLRLRRVDDNDTIETIMGAGFEAAPTEGALAVDTPLHHASDVEFDDQGNMYLAGNHVSLAFRVDPDNRVHIVAGNIDDPPGNDGDGGPALSAHLGAPYGVLPANGGLYISDVDNSNVRYVDANGIIHTVAGNGSPGYSGDGGPGPQAQLYSPTGLARDSSGNLYICDTTNSVIRRVDLNGIITTFAGIAYVGTATYSGDGGPATAAHFSAPYDLQFASDGSLYVADTGNNVIRRIDRNGIVTTVVGTGMPGFAGDGGDARTCQLNGPAGLRFGPDGALWIADTFNNRIRRVAGSFGQ